ncbi:MAG: efflux RND transporter periplasmic adaptor subunit [Acetobacteraceae bacterium]
MSQLAEPEQDVDARLEQRRRRNTRLLGLAVLTLLGGLVTLGAMGNAARRTETVDTLTARLDAVPVVKTQTLTPIDTPRKLDLSGTTEAFDSATLFARATGYISKRNVDIGSHVKAGDVLAVISAPDLDQQLAQARGQLAQMQAAVVQAQANMDLARATNDRTKRLVKDGWSSEQQGDVDRLTLASRVAAVSVAQANLLAQQAQVDRLQQLTDFERVVAPFSGVITSRQVDVGSLVTADSATGTPLFSIAHTDVLRVLVYVPQEVFFGLKDGEPATVTVPQLPGRVFHGVVARNANALQQQTRTLLAEVDVNNADGTLAPGLYAVVHLDVPRTHPVVLVPSEAVIFDKNGLSAAIYQDGKARLRHLDLSADDGAHVEVRAGLAGGDQLILDPPVGLTDGTRVAVATPPAAPPGTTKPGTTPPVEVSAR